MSVALDLLGGAERKRTRVRGFAPWTPHGDTQQLLDQVRGVLGEYEDYLPLTIRQIFYRLVGAHEYEKTERAYQRLCEHLNRARRAGLVSMSAIRDDGGTILESNTWRDTDEFVETVRGMAEGFTLDRTTGQSARLVVMCEAAGMAPQLHRVTDPFSIPVMSGGGFDSVTDKYRFASGLSLLGRPTEVLHIGDHDPSGAHMFLAVLEDIAAFAGDLGGDVTFTRLAVTPSQIAECGLPTAPPKPTDSRAFHGQTCQAEALAPDVLASIVRDAIEARLDLRARVTARARRTPGTARALGGAVMTDASVVRYKLERLLKPLARDGSEALNAIRDLLASPQRPTDLIAPITKILALQYRGSIPIDAVIDVVEAAIERGELP